MRRIQTWHYQKLSFVTCSKQKEMFCISSFAFLFLYFYSAKSQQRSPRGPFILKGKDPTITQKNLTIRLKIFHAADSDICTHNHLHWVISRKTSRSGINSSMVQQKETNQQQVSLWKLFLHRYSTINYKCYCKIKALMNQITPTM